MIEKYTKIDGNVIVTDLRNVETIYTENRFLIIKNKRCCYKLTWFSFVVAYFL